MKRHPLEILAYAAEHYPKSIEMVPLKSVTVDSARQNGKRPAYLTIRVNDEIAKQIRGNEERDLLMLVLVPKYVIDRQESPIVLPSEAPR